MTGFFKVFSIDVYSLLDPGATLPFLIPLLAKQFDVLPNDLIEPLSVTTPVGDYVVTKRVFRSCPISLTNRVTWVVFAELDMVDFDVILGMDWLHACFSSIDC